MKKIQTGLSKALDASLTEQQRRQWAEVMKHVGAKRLAKSAPDLLYVVLRSWSWVARQNIVSASGGVTVRDLIPMAVENATANRIGLESDGSTMFAIHGNLVKKPRAKVDAAAILHGIGNHSERNNSSRKRGAR